MSWRWVKDHCVRDPGDESDTRWEYTCHQQLFGYEPPTLEPVDQIENLCRSLAETPYTRRAQAITWEAWEDNSCYDPACLQNVWCRIIEKEGEPRLNMNVRFRSNDAYTAAMMNIFPTSTPIPANSAIRAASSWWRPWH